MPCHGRDVVKQGQQHTLRRDSSEARNTASSRVLNPPSRVTKLSGETAPPNEPGSPSEACLTDSTQSASDSAVSIGPALENVLSFRLELDSV